MAIALPTTAAHAADNATISAAPCGVAAGRDASNNTVTCNYGLTPEQLKQLTEAAVRGATEPLARELADVSKTLGVTENAAKTILKIVGEDPNIPEDKLAEALSNVAADYQQLKAKIAALDPDNPMAKALVEQAKPEIEAGHFSRAHELLHEAAQAQIAAAKEARKLAKQAQAAEDAQMLGAASSTAAEGGVALTERRYKEAADLFGQAVDEVPSGYKSEHGAYLMWQGHALYRQGDELGDNVALRSAIEVYERALTDYSRGQVPLGWAQTENDLGVALAILGERESRTEKLEESIAAFSAALEERTRERVPLDWAVTENGLANALTMLGELEGSTARFEEAVVAFRAVLQELTLEGDMFKWGATQMNFAIALWRLGERESDRARLEAAVAAYRAAI